ncbi:MAG: hypothetical protein LC779_13600 [Actinobacteria bacterium]|nr:hypothetical protein [Actinomycetota bacterium]
MRRVGHRHPVHVDQHQRCPLLLRQRGERGLCYQLGQNVGELPRRPGALDALVASTPSPEAGVSAASITRAP